jgi:hypothetical protein
MGSGKSTAIEFLKDFRPHKTGFANVKFAEPLYHMQEMIYRRIAAVHLRPQDFVKDRKLLQWLGTEWGRGTISDTIWVDLWRAKVAEVTEYWTRNGMDTWVTCDDVRFDNEAEAVKALGGYIIKLTSSRNLERITTNTGIKAHASEAGISANLVDFEVENSDSVSSFHEKLKNVFEHIVRNNQRR